MASFVSDIYFYSLGMNTQVNIINPADVNYGTPRKVLFLLHGLNDNASCWQRFTGVERLAQKYNYAVIMPEVQRSFYADMNMGCDYFEHITKDLPATIEHLLNIKCDPENTYIAGLSMGGYGALKCALTYPQNYAGCAAFSSCTDIYTKGVQLDMPEEFKAIYKDGMPGDGDDLFKLATEASKLPAGEKPYIYHACGTEDFLYKENIRFRDHMQSLDFDYKYEEWKGVHCWDFWNVAIDKAIEHFEEKRKQEGRK